MSSQYQSVLQDERIEELLKTEAKSNTQGIKKQQKLKFFDYLIAHISHAITIIMLVYLIYLIANLFICKGFYLNHNSDSNQPQIKRMNILTSNYFSDQTESSKTTLTNELSTVNNKKYKNIQPTVNSETEITIKNTKTLQISKQIDVLSLNSKINKRQSQSSIVNSHKNNSQQNQQTVHMKSNTQNHQMETVAQQKNSNKVKTIKQKYQQFAQQLQLNNQTPNSVNQQNDHTGFNPTLNFLSSTERTKIAMNYIQQSEDPKSIYLQFLEQNQQLRENIYSSNIQSNSASTENNTFCIIVSTFNNAQSNQIERTMASIFNQEYSKYHIIAVDKSSTDDTVQLLNNFIYKSPLLTNKTKIIESKESSQVEAITEGLKYCKKGQIAILMNGDSQLLSKKVLSMTNSIYELENPRILYSDAFSLDIKNRKIKQIKGKQYNEQQKAMNLYRDVGHKYGKYFTFNTNLVSKLKHKNMVDDNGKWLKYSGNEALILSLLELSCGKISYLNEPVLFHQYNSDLNDYQRHGLAIQRNIIAHKDKLFEC